MVDNTVHQIISAYTTGCLDRDNFIQFMNYMREGGELPKGEMGELQNVTSLIPTLLELEEPPPDLKNQVAKRILELEAERKKKVKKTAVPKTEPEVVVDNKTKTREKTSATEVLKEEVNKDKTKTFEKIEKHDVDQKEKVPESNLIPWIILGVVSLVLVISTVYFLFMNNALKDEVADIKIQLSSFQSEVVQTNKFVNEHIELIEFLNYKNVEIVNFQPTENKPDAYGKLFISLDVGEAILQLKNMPRLTSRESFQLWMVNETQSFSLGTVFPNPGVEYYKIKNLPSLDKKDILMFRITKEVRGGSDTPQGQLFLFGAFYNTRDEETTPASGRRR